MAQPTDLKSRRKHPRINFRGRAVFFFGKDSEVAETIQISEGGMMALTGMRLEVGDSLTIHFTVNEAYLRARGQVVYMLEPSEDGRRKVGLRFQSLFEEYRTILRELKAQN